MKAINEKSFLFLFEYGNILIARESVIRILRDNVAHNHSCLWNLMPALLMKQIVCVFVH